MTLEQLHDGMKRVLKATHWDLKTDIESEVLRIDEGRIQIDLSTPTSDLIWYSVYSYREVPSTHYDDPPEVEEVLVYNGSSVIDAFIAVISHLQAEAIEGALEEWSGSPFTNVLDA